MPADHLLRKIDSAVDFSHIYDIVEDLYCADNGRPSIDPVVIFKMVLIQHLYGLPSLRRTVEEIKMNVAYRWFLGYPMNEQIPHFSTVSYNFKHRYTEKTIEDIFYWILNEIETAGYLSPEAVFVDGTHIKANANLKKAVKKAVPQAAKIYEKQLMEEINEERNDHGKKPFDESKPPEEKEISESTTDPESGVFHKGEHKKCFAYTAQTCCDKNGYIMDVIDETESFPSYAQARRIRKAFEKGKLNYDTVTEIMAEIKPNQVEKLKIPMDDIRKYVPSSMTPAEMLEYLLKLVKKEYDRQHSRDAR